MKKRSRQKRSREPSKPVYRSPSPDCEDPSYTAPPAGTGRTPSALCRLCHGKFSSRSLRHAFSSSSRDHVDSEEQRSVLFHSDFQRLVGVKLNQDPRLSKFICKTCHSKFYKCYSILLRFLQRVNLPPMGAERRRKKAKTVEPLEQREMPWCFTSDHQCLHSLVSWAHHHAGACSSCPALMDVLESQCRGSVRALWGCGDGHSYEMDTYFSCPEPEPEAEEPTEESQLNPEEHVESSEQNHGSNNEGEADMSEPEEATPFPLSQAEDADEEELCDRTETGGEAEENVLGPDDELFKPYANKRCTDKCDRQFSEKPAEGLERCYSLSLSTPRVSRKKKQSHDSTEETPVRNKPGPKPGWKNKFKIKGEELPSMFKCPYLGCTAVYRGADGLKKHIREHHEEVKERPCPHPGCNKVFMIDRYLQRHIKLIHTEERNYICDECGQTFKQRKHLSVHQMRHSGAKPLQ